MDLDSRLDELSRRLDLLTDTRHSPHQFFPVAQQFCANCSSPTHFVSECPATPRFPEYVYDQVYQDQNQMAYGPGNNPYFNSYNSDWGAQPNFSWEPQPVDIPYCDMPYSQYQPSPINFEPALGEGLQQALKELEHSSEFDTNPDSFAQLCQSIVEHQQSFNEQMNRTDQILLALSKKEEGNLPSQPESNLEGQYLAPNFSDPQNYHEQPTIITFGNEMVNEQPYTTITTNTENSTEVEAYREESECWDEPIPSSPYLPMVPLPSALESSTPFNEKEGQIDEVMEFIETSQEPQLNNTIEEAIPIILSQDSLNPSVAHFEVDDFDDDGYTIEVNNLLDTPYPKNSPLWIEKYEPPLCPPIAHLLEAPTALELKPLPDVPTDILPVTLNQEDQLVGVLNEHKEAVGWDIADMRDNDFKIFMIDFSVFGTSFKDCLQNLSTILNQCMETNLRLSWIKCHSNFWNGVTSQHIIPEKGRRVDWIRIDKIFKLPSPISDEQKQPRPDRFKIYKNNFQTWSKMLVKCTLVIRANYHRILHERFSAMMTRPPDWPCPFAALRVPLKFIIYWTL